MSAYLAVYLSTCTVYIWYVHLERKNSAHRLIGQLITTSARFDESRAENVHVINIMSNLHTRTSKVGKAGKSIMKWDSMFLYKWWAETPPSWTVEKESQASNRWHAEHPVVHCSKILLALRTWSGIRRLCVTIHWFQACEYPSFCCCCLDSS